MEEPERCTRTHCSGHGGGEHSSAVSARWESPPPPWRGGSRRPSLFALRDYPQLCPKVPSFLPVCLWVDREGGLVQGEGGSGDLELSSRNGCKWAAAPLPKSSLPPPPSTAPLAGGLCFLAVCCCGGGEKEPVSRFRGRASWERTGGEGACGGWGRETAGEWLWEFGAFPGLLSSPRPTLGAGGSTRRREEACCCCSRI